MKKAISLKQLAEAKTDGVQKTTQFQVDPRIIEIQEGFNARPIDRAHVESMKIAKRNGSVFPPVFVRVEDGRIIMVDGHHRLTADLELIDEGFDVKRIDCMHFRGNDAERIALMLTTAQGKPLTPLEMGFQYKKLIALGWTAPEISNKVGKGRNHVDDMVFLANAPSEVHNMIRDNSVSATLALSVVREHGEKAAEVLKKEHGKAAATGKTKVTKKTMTGGKPTAADIRAEERERCAKLCEEFHLEQMAKLIRELI